MKKGLSCCVCVLLWFCWLQFACAQAVLATTNPSRRGTGDLTVSVQSYYNRVNGATVSNIESAAVSLRHFFPRHGLFSLQLEPVTSRGEFGLGENYAHWTGLPWMGRHWDFAGGDFRARTAMVETPFTNLNMPELSLRGARVVARTDNWGYSFYRGSETLSQGNRVPYRVGVPQSALGVEAAGHVGSRFHIGFRVLRLASPANKVVEEKLFFPVNRRFSRSASVTTQANLRLSEALEWYTEAGWSRVSDLASSGIRRAPLSFVFGPAWNTSRYTLRANYTSQGTGYLPVLGYYMGDRRGPHVEGLAHLGPISFFGTWLQTRNNRERDPAVSDYSSRQHGGGLQVRLPGQFSVNGSISKINLDIHSPETGHERNESRQVLLTVSRPLYRHNLRATGQRIDTDFRGIAQRLEFLELEDNYTWRRFTAGGSVRWQRFFSEQRSQSLFFRGSAQIQLRHVSLYGYWEQGKDLANATLFATNVSSTSVVGVAWDSPAGLRLRLEGFRNRFHSKPNPENLFVLGSRGITPDTILSQTNDWSLFLRVAREFAWGEPMSVDAQGRPYQDAPLIGTLAGFVRLRTLAGETGASDVWVITDSGHVAKTDANGYFQISDVPQGAWTVKLDLDRLPADFDPGDQKQTPTQVRSGQVERVELQVTPLQSVEGWIKDADGNAAGEGIILRLLPADQYTTTDRLGRFGFYNLPEGEYEILVVTESLPEATRLASSPVLAATLRYGEPAPPAEFRYEAAPALPKPTRRVLERDRVVAPKAASPPPKGRVIIRGTAKNIPVTPPRGRRVISVLR